MLRLLCVPLSLCCAAALPALLETCSSLPSTLLVYCCLLGSAGRRTVRLLRAVTGRFLRLPENIAVLFRCCWDAAAACQYPAIAGCSCCAVHCCLLLRSSPSCADFTCLYYACRLPLPGLPRTGGRGVLDLRLPGSQLRLISAPADVLFSCCAVKPGCAAFSAFSFARLLARTFPTVALRFGYAVARRPLHAACTVTIWFRFLRLYVRFSLAFCCGGRSYYLPGWCYWCRVASAVRCSGYLSCCLLCS